MSAPGTRVFTYIGGRYCTCVHNTLGCVCSHAFRLLMLLYKQSRILFDVQSLRSEEKWYMDNKQNNEHSVLCSYGYTVHAYIGLHAVAIHNYINTM